MRLLLVFIFLCISTPCGAAIKIISSQNNSLDSLRNEISKLETQLKQKTDTLNKCAQENKNFQIAGIATVGLAGAGVATNISLYSKIKDQKKIEKTLNSKIANAKLQEENFLNDVDKLSENLDYDKFLQNLDSQLTETEKQQIIRLYENDSDFEDNISDSDKKLFEKMVNIMQQSQK